MAGFRPSQVVIGIAGELVEGLHDRSTMQERKKPTAPITEQELQKLIDGVQREALRQAERAITWETGLPHVDVRLVHAAVTGASIDGYALTQPGRLPGPPRPDRHLQRVRAAGAPRRAAVAWRRSWTSSCSRSSPSRTPSRACSGPTRSARPARSSSTSAAARPTSRSCAAAASRARGCSPSAAAHSRNRLADRLDLPFPRAEQLKVDYARGLHVERHDEVARIVSEDVAVWAAGVELVMEELSGGDLLPGRIYMCGGGSALPEIQTALRRRGVLAAPAVQPAARGDAHGRPTRSRR